MKQVVLIAALLGSIAELWATSRKTVIGQFKRGQEVVSALKSLQSPEKARLIKIIADQIDLLSELHSNDMPYFERIATVYTKLNKFDTSPKMRQDLLVMIRSWNEAYKRLSELPPSSRKTSK